jgi:hypothetical protein
VGIQNTLRTWQDVIAEFKTEVYTVSEITLQTGQGNQIIPIGTPARIKIMGNERVDAYFPTYNQVIHNLYSICFDRD